MGKILTVVVPTYNAEAYLRKNLESFCISEILEDIDVLVINDGSTDKSLEIAMEYAERFPDSYRVITKENGGHGSGINWGVDHALGKYFKVVDADDWVEQEGFIRLVGHLKGTDADMVLSNYHWVDHVTGKQTCEVEEVCPGILYGVTYPFTEWSEKIFMKMHAVTYRTELLRNQPERLDEHCFYVDTEYIVFPLPYVKTISAIPDFVYQYRIGIPGQSMSMENMQKRCAQHEKVLRRLLAYYEEMKENPAEPAIRNMVARVAVSQYKIYLSFPESHKREMMRLERVLWRKYPEIYQTMTNKAVRVLRKSRYLLYPLASMALQKTLKGKGI